MKQELIENFIGKKVTIYTTNGTLVEGLITLNTNSKYPEAMYMVDTGRDATYYFNDEAVETIVEGE